MTSASWDGFDEIPGVEAALRADPGIASVGDAQMSDGVGLLSAIPRAAPSTSELSRTIDRVRSELPAGAVIGGGVADITTSKAP